MWWYYVLAQVRGGLDSQGYTKCFTHHFLELCVFQKMWWFCSNDVVVVFQFFHSPSNKPLWLGGNTPIRRYADTSHRGIPRQENRKPFGDFGMFCSSKSYLDMTTTSHGLHVCNFIPVSSATMWFLSIPLCHGKRFWNNWQNGYRYEKHGRNECVCVCVVLLVWLICGKGKFFDQKNIWPFFFYVWNIYLDAIHSH